MRCTQFSIMLRTPQCTIIHNCMSEIIALYFCSIQGRQQSVVGTKIKGGARLVSHLSESHNEFGASGNCNVSQDHVFCGLPINHSNWRGDSEDLLSDCHRYSTPRQHLHIFPSLPATTNSCRYLKKMKSQIRRIQQLSIPK
jgi:hypothetical protein